MLNNTEHPVAWATLMHELSDAYEHLGALIDQMIAVGAIDEADFGIQMGHIFAHMNRAWHGRNDVQLNNVSEGLHGERSQFPVDLTPVG